MARVRNDKKTAVGTPLIGVLNVTVFEDQPAADHVDLHVPILISDIPRLFCLSLKDEFKKVNLKKNL